MIDLYAELDVPKDAPPDAVRKAYRKRAKRAHPDGGGTPEKFAVLRLAHDILTDAGRRKKYDDTGDASEKAVDNAEAEARNIAFGAINNVLMAIEQKGYDPEQFDLVADAKRNIHEQRAGIERTSVQQENGSKKLRRMAARFRTKKNKENRIAPMMVARAEELERHAASNLEILAKMDRALQLLDEHTFDCGIG